MSTISLQASVAQFSLNQIWATFMSISYTQSTTVKSELMCFFLHHSFSTAYQCIYYSPEHTAKAQEVLSTMSFLQPLITSLADQLLQAAQEHSSPGLRDALKNLSDKVRQPPNPPLPSKLPLYSSWPQAAATNSFILGHITKHCRLIPQPEKPFRLIFNCGDKFI